ncbi:MAG: hypothetical protein EBV06_02720 [Planctomycetia bacterium]|nr:hypothetical protein [Planctomycetia bacterium]
MFRFSGLLVFSGFILTGLLGCGGAASYQVEGVVTLDNTALAEGDIMFIPVDKKSGPEGGKIKEGKYSLKAPAGDMRVEVRAVRATGKTTPSAAGPGAPGDPVYESIIPERYNTNSELKASVGSGKTKFDFALKSK